MEKNEYIPSDENMVVTGPVAIEGNCRGLFVSLEDCRDHAMQLHGLIAARKIERSGDIFGIIDLERLLELFESVDASIGRDPSDC